MAVGEASSIERRAAYGKSSTVPFSAATNGTFTVAPNTPFGAVPAFGRREFPAACGGGGPEGPLPGRTAAAKRRPLGPAALHGMPVPCATAQPTRLSGLAWNYPVRSGAGLRPARVSGRLRRRRTGRSAHPESDPGETALPFCNRHGVPAINALAVEISPPGKRVLWVRGPSGPLPGRTAAAKRRPLGPAALHGMPVPCAPAQPRPGCPDLHGTCRQSGADLRPARVSGRLRRQRTGRSAHPENGRQAATLSTALDCSMRVSAAWAQRRLPGRWGLGLSMAPATGLAAATSTALAPRRVGTSRADLRVPPARAGWPGRPSGPARRSRRPRAGVPGPGTTRPA